MTKDEVIASMAIVAINKDDVIYLSLPSTRAVMDEYAKQQAMAFFKFCLPGPSDFEPHISKRYQQFIEQQNKDGK